MFNRKMLIINKNNRLIQSTVNDITRIKCITINSFGTNLFGRKERDILNLYFNHKSKNLSDKKIFILK